MQTAKQTNSEWIKISAKGLITLPKKMRESIGLKEGSIAKATLKGSSIVIESVDPPFKGRLYTDAQLETWVVEDKLSDKDLKKHKKLLDELWEDTP